MDELQELRRELNLSMSKQQYPDSEITGFKDTRLSIICRIFLVFIISFLFSIYFYFVSAYWINLPGQYQNLYQVIVFSVMAWFIWWYTNRELKFVRKKRIYLFSKSDNLALLIGVVIITAAVISVILMPYPPIFNIHAYNILDLGKYFLENSSLPFFNSESMVSISVQTNLYPQHSIFAFILAIIGISDTGSLAYFTKANLTSIFFFFASLLPAFILFDKNTNVIFSIGIFFLAMLSIPPLFEVFIKYPTSDTFVIFTSTAVMASTLIFLKTGKLKLLFFIIAFSLVLRLYFAIICFVFIVLLFSFLLFKDSHLFIYYVKGFFSKKKNILFFLFCLTISVSWFYTSYNEYRIFLPDFKNIGLISNSDLTQVERLNRDYSGAIIDQNVLEENSLKELTNSILTKDIYYKTFENKVSKKNVFINICENIFSTVIILFATLSFIVFSLVKRKTTFFMDNTNIVCILWGSAVIISWILFYDSSYSLVKIFFFGVPAMSVLLAKNITEITKNNKHQYLLLTTVIGYLCFSFIFHNLIKPIYEIQQLDVINEGYQQSHFITQYGDKRELLKFLERNKIENENILWVVRAEHGGIISYFVDDKHFWERNWYDSPQFHELHIANNEKELMKTLKEKDINYIIAMNDKGINRFFRNVFKKTLYYPEILLDLIQNNPKKLLKKIFREKERRGLELIIFKVI